MRVGFLVSGSFILCQESLGQYLVTTDKDGKANCTYTGNYAGTETITAFADTNNNSSLDNGEPSATATKRWRSAPATSITLEPKSEVRIVATEGCVTARAKNETGPAGDQTVSFTVTGANPQSKALTTNYNGEVTFCYKGEKGGLDTITAFVDSNESKTKDESEPEDTATKRWLSNQPSITLTPEAAENPLGTTHTLTATVTDAGKPVEGVRVGFLVSGSFILCQESLGQYLVTTDKDGKANCTYTGNYAGTETITAFADTNNNSSLDNGEPSATATKRWRSAPATSITLEPKSEVRIVATEGCVTARAKNETGPAGDQTVSFTVTGANPQSKALTTNYNGEVTFCYKGEKGGLDTITAFVDSNESKTKDESEPEDTATKRWLSNQPSITLTPEAAENPLGTTHTLTATVTDAGKPVEGVRVGFLVSGSFILCQESLGQYLVTTDKDGKANCTYTGNYAGTETITAFADTNNNSSLDNGEPSATATKTWVEHLPPATSLTISPSAATNVVKVQHCLTAIARLEGGEPAGNRSVLFTVTGANPRPAEEHTDRLERRRAVLLHRRKRRPGHDHGVRRQRQERKTGHGRSSGDGKQVVALAAAGIARPDASRRDQPDQHDAHSHRDRHRPRQPDRKREGGLRRQGNEPGDHEGDRRERTGVVQLLERLRKERHDRRLRRHKRQRHQGRK